MLVGRLCLCGCSGDWRICAVAGLYQFYESVDGTIGEAGEGGGHPQVGGIVAGAADRAIPGRIGLYCVAVFRAVAAAGAAGSALVQ
jgi:hypothetical protein